MRDEGGRVSLWKLFWVLVLSVFIRVYLRLHSGFLGALGVLAVRICLIGVYRRSSAAQKP
jgi:hypothetical protein